MCTTCIEYIHMLISRTMLQYTIICFHTRSQRTHVFAEMHNRVSLTRFNIGHIRLFFANHPSHKENTTCALTLSSPPIDRIWHALSAQHTHSGLATDNLHHIRTPQSIIYARGHRPRQGLATSFQPNANYIYVYIYAV